MQIPDNTYNFFFIHLSVDGQLGCFHILTIINGATLNIRVHVSFPISVFVFWGNIHIYQEWNCWII